MRLDRRPVAIAALAAALITLPVHAASISEAQTLIDKGLYKQALQQIDTLLDANPDNTQAKFLHAVAQARMGQTNAAIEAFAALAKAYPDAPEPANNLAVLYAQQGDYEKARRWLESAMSTHPAYATAHRNLGDVYTARAAVAYSRALEQEQSSDLGVDLEMVQSFSGTADRGSATALAQSARSQPAAPSQPRPVMPARNPEPFEPADTADKPLATRPAPAPAATPAQTATAPAPQPAASPTTAPTPAQTTPATAPVAQPAGQSPAEARAAILAAVENWARAWASQDVEGYLNSYADNFYPGDGLSLPQWKAQRRQRVGKPGDIAVRVVNPEVSLQAEDRASVTFRQTYESINYSDQVSKTLTMQRNDGRWLIVRETSQPL
jgi:hypothetical protein